MSFIIFWALTVLFIWQLMGQSLSLLVFIQNILSPVFVYYCLVWLVYQIRYQETTTDSQDC